MGDGSADWQRLINGITSAMGNGSADWQRLSCLLSIGRLGRLAETLLFASGTKWDGSADWQRLIKDTNTAKPQHTAIA
eukprot:scaffold30456_cov66-Cyclotella_meneghiniana.AAC.2